MIRSCNLEIKIRIQMVQLFMSHSAWTIVIEHTHEQNSTNKTHNRKYQIMSLIPYTNVKCLSHCKRIPFSIDLLTRQGCPSAAMRPKERTRTIPIIFLLYCQSDGFCSFFWEKRKYEMEEWIGKKTVEWGRETNGTCVLLVFSMIIWS